MQKRGQTAEWRTKGSKRKILQRCSLGRLGVMKVRWLVGTPCLVYSIGIVETIEVEKAVQFSRVVFFVLARVHA